MLELRRVILFTPRLEAMTAFYRDVIGLEVVRQEEGWVELAAGACAIALHAGAS
ncbi:VOC family protein, partial [Acinetobacter baumannii]